MKERMQEELETKTGQEETGQKEARQKGGGKFVRRMLRIFVTQWPLLALAVVTAVLQCAAELFLPRVMAEVVNDGVLRSNQEVVQTGITRMLMYGTVEK